MSAPKLARLKVIREHLIPIYLEHFDRNVLSEQTAYALARMQTAGLNYSIYCPKCGKPAARIEHGEREDKYLHFTKKGSVWHIVRRPPEVSP